MNARYGGNDDMQACFFREIKMLKEVNFFKVLFDKITGASSALLELVKEVG
jgi:hypothetical protein